MHKRNDSLWCAAHILLQRLEGIGFMDSIKDAIDALQETVKQYEKQCDHNNNLPPLINGHVHMSTQNYYDEKGNPTHIVRQYSKTCDVCGVMETDVVVFPKNPHKCVKRPVKWETKDV